MKMSRFWIGAFWGSNCNQVLSNTLLDSCMTNLLWYICIIHRAWYNLNDTYCMIHFIWYILYDTSCIIYIVWNIYRIHLVWYILYETFIVIHASFMINLVWYILMIHTVVLWKYQVIALFDTSCMIQNVSCKCAERLRKRSLLLNKLGVDHVVWARRLRFALLWTTLTITMKPEMSAKQMTRAMSAFNAE